MPSSVFLLESKEEFTLHIKLCGPKTPNSWMLFNGGIENG